MKERSKKAEGRKALRVVEDEGVRQTVREGLLELVVRAGQEAIAAILEEDVLALCGGRHERRAAGSPMRWGEQGGAVVLGGRRVKVTRPRVRQDGREVELPSYAQFQREDPLEERAMTQMAEDEDFDSAVHNSMEQIRADKPLVRSFFEHPEAAYVKRALQD